MQPLLLPNPEAEAAWPVVSFISCVPSPAASRQQQVDECLELLPREEEALCKFLSGSRDPSISEQPGTGDSGGTAKTKKEAKKGLARREGHCHPREEVPPRNAIPCDASEQVRGTCVAGTGSPER